MSAYHNIWCSPRFSPLSPPCHWPVARVRVQGIDINVEPSARIGVSWDMRVKLLLFYDIRPGAEEQYYHFMSTEFLFWVHEQGLMLSDAWHTLYGSYPSRVIGLVAEDVHHLTRVLTSQEWAELEARMQDYVTNYQRRVIPYRGGFQIY